MVLFPMFHAHSKTLDPLVINPTVKYIIVILVAFPRFLIGESKREVLMELKVNT